MSEISCFWAVQTGRGIVKLRRYIGELEGGRCPGIFGYHNASVVIGERSVETVADSGYGRSCRAVDVPPVPDADDARWPHACACGYVFPARAERQVRCDELYAGSPDGIERPLMELAPGAVWRAWWYEDQAKWSNGDDSPPMFRIHPTDGMCISVRTPNGEWCVDQRTAQGTYWTRTALPLDLVAGASLPMLTANPSISQPRYHGWLREGKLIQC